MNQLSNSDTSIDEGAYLLLILVLMKELSTADTSIDEGAIYC